MEKIKQILKVKFLNADGTLNKTVVVSSVTLLIVLVDQILAVFNVFPVHQDQVVAVLNTILTILSIFGFVEGPETAQIISPKIEAVTPQSLATSAAPKAAPVTDQKADSVADSSASSSSAQVASEAASLMPASASLEAKSAVTPTATTDSADSSK